MGFTYLVGLEFGELFVPILLGWSYSLIFGASPWRVAQATQLGVHSMPKHRFEEKL